MKLIYYISKSNPLETERREIHQHLQPWNKLWKENVPKSSVKNIGYFFLQYVYHYIKEYIIYYTVLLVYRIMEK